MLWGQAAAAVTATHVQPYSPSLSHEIPRNHASHAGLSLGGKFEF